MALTQKSSSFKLTILPSFSAMADIVTAAWALVVHDCDVSAEHVIETISSEYSLMPASIPETRCTWSNYKHMILATLVDVRCRQSGQRARPAVSQTHPTQVRLLWTLWSCLLQGPSSRRSRRESFIIVCHLLYLFLREQLSQYTFVFASEPFNRPKTIENNNISLLPGVFSSQISSHSDSLEDVLLLPVNITTP